ncbi:MULTISPECIES: molybdopterin molybdotransferase MoeA [Acidianus]|uniref:Molybdenum cofactor synthesis protein n=1 Tax=Candidatus Acidianus copahuensis TaxID=1160895 RepID=A0A031LLX1_9CREN|nr:MULTISPECIES: molybdopterin molybdotransferase MoeA [Acidianus]EZQ03212.1 molybdenum cofactor synthesis protein [Candidatus Acidianus copahuensis]NON63615.1 molybdopterin molybdotransferase MoeA [Acidianus sp. RZ1]
MLISLDEARKLIDQKSFSDPNTKVVPLLASVGKICAENIVSKIDIPSRDLSAMDGYAIKIGNDSTKLKIKGKLFPSSKEVPLISQGEAYYVTTGSPIPIGSNAVVRLEASKVEDGWLYIGENVYEGKDIRPKGEDIKKGEIILRKGEIISPYHLGILNIQKIREVKVFNINFAVFANGDEIAPYYEDRDIPDSISPVLIPILEKFGEVHYLGVARDSEESVREKMKEALKYDFVISIGGSSVGEKDFIKKVIKSLGELLFEGVSVNIVKRGGVGLIERKPILVLPGQIVSSVVSFHEHGLHLISRLIGSEIREYKDVSLLADLKVDHKMDSVYLLKETEEGAIPLRWGVGLFSELYKASGFTILKRGTTYEIGSKIKMQKFMV